MPRTALTLPDINVWIALAFEVHAQHAAACRWRAAADDEALVFCRMTQQGFLRLITNPAVLGQEALTLAKAWQLYDRLQALSYVTFLAEPAGIEPVWRQFTGRRRYSPKVWNDAYLAAFALRSGCRLVTFDRGFAQYDRAPCTILEP